MGTTPSGIVPDRWTEEADVVIVGTGYAGLSAALTARELGMSVLLLEKMAVPGGNSVISQGGANAVDPVRQKRQGVQDSTDLHFRQTMEGGDRLNDPEKVRYLVDHALEDCVHYFERMGVIWPEEVVRGYGALYERTHRNAAFVDRNGKRWKNGAALIHAMLQRMEGTGQRILFGHRVTRILREEPLDGRVLGVEAQAGRNRRTFRAGKGVILASGGFAANLEWVSRHDRRLAQTDTSNHKGATGECIRLAEDIGADTIHMDFIQAIPFEVRSPFKAMFYQIESEEIRKASSSMSYRIFVNSEGRRFVDEGGRRDAITATACAQPLFDPKRKLQADSIGELEAMLALPTGSLAETVRRYNAACVVGKDPDFGKDPSILVPLKTGPFIAVTKALMRHHCMGGLLVKGTTGQVIDRRGKMIPGLFAAGEVTGGTHGANRLGHNATVDCVVFGQRCARSAAGVKG